MLSLDLLEKPITITAAFVGLFVVAWNLYKGIVFFNSERLEKEKYRLDFMKDYLETNFPQVSKSWVVEEGFCILTRGLRLSQQQISLILGQENPAKLIKDFRFCSTSVILDMQAVSFRYIKPWNLRWFRIVWLLFNLSSCLLLFSYALLLSSLSMLKIQQGELSGYIVLPLVLMIGIATAYVFKEVLEIMVARRLIKLVLTNHTASRGD